MLQGHLSTYAVGRDGHLFVSRTGAAGVPLPGPYAKPVSMKTVYRVWHNSRLTALTDKEFDSPLARRPYDLRHACVSTWLNAGVLPAQVAECAGHSVNVLLTVYAKCIDGAEVSAIRKRESAYNTADDPPETSRSGHHPEASPPETSPSIPPDTRNEPILAGLCRTCRHPNSGRLPSARATSESLQSSGYRQERVDGIGVSHCHHGVNRGLAYSETIGSARFEQHHAMSDMRIAVGEERKNRCGNPTMEMSALWRFIGP